MHRQHRAVHRHADAHLVERDAVEQRAGVVDRVDRHAGHADVTAHARVVGVVAAVGGQVEGDAEALLAGRQVAPVERVGLLGGGEPGVLPDRPRLGRVHRRVGPAQERREARVGVERVEALEVLGRRRPAGSSMPSGLTPRLAPVVEEPAPLDACHETGDASGSPAKLFGTLMPAPPASGAGRRGRRRRPRRSRRPGRRVACRRGPPSAHRPRAGGGRRSAAPLGVRRVGAGQADDRLAVVRREQVVGARRGAGDVDGDAAGGEQVGGERRPGGVRGHRPIVARKTGRAAGSSRSASKAAP